MEPSLVALFGSFLPGTLHLAFDSEPLVWRLSNAALGLLGVVAGAAFIARSRLASATIGQRVFLVPVGLAVVALLLAACGSSTAAVRTVDADKAVGMLDSRVVIDVRTPAEYAAGHVAGARNIDVEGPDFAAQIASLDPEGAYLVYCRSGRRSAIAADQMAAAGFTDIVDGGGLEALVAAGAPVE